MKIGQKRVILADVAEPAYITILHHGLPELRISLSAAQWSEILVHGQDAPPLKIGPDSEETFYTEKLFHGRRYHHFRYHENAYPTKVGAAFIDHQFALLSAIIHLDRLVQGGNLITDSIPARHRYITRMQAALDEAHPSFHYPENCEDYPGERWRHIESTIRRIPQSEMKAILRAEFPYATASHIDGIHSRLMSHQSLLQIIPLLVA